MTNGWSSFCMICLSLMIGLIFCSLVSLSLRMIFMAYSLPVSFFLTSITLLNAPLPMTLIYSKSCLVTFLFSSWFCVKLSLAKCARRNSPSYSTPIGLLYYVSQKSRLSLISSVLRATMNFFFNFTCWFIILILCSRVFLRIIWIIFKF